jgi:hypothetical protein
MLPLTNRQKQLLEEGKTPFDQIFPAQELFGEYYTHPEKFHVTKQIDYIKNILSRNRDQECVVFLGRLLTKNIRDAREAINVQRGISKIHNGNPLSLNFNLADDTGFIKCKISTRDYLKLAKEIVESGVVDESWYIIRGRFGVKFNMVFVDKLRKLK